jgi:hypothetical protein
MTDLEPTPPPVAPPPAPPDPLARARKEASWGLLGLALFLLGLGALGALMPRLLGATIDPREAALALGATLALAVAFGGLGLWARRRPLPAALLGLALYLAFTALNPVIGLLLILLAALLVKASWTCLRARQS